MLATALLTTEIVLEEVTTCFHHIKNFLLHETILWASHASLWSDNLPVPGPLVAGQLLAHGSAFAVAREERVRASSLVGWVHPGGESWRMQACRGRDYYPKKRLRDFPWPLLMKS